MNRAGKTAVRAARAMRTEPSSTRLAKDFEHVTAELRHLVEEEHAVVREADLAGPRMLPAADERHVRDRVMRRPERALGQQSRAGRQEPGHGMDRRRLERLVERQRREDRRPLAAPSWSCRRPAGRPSGRCGRPRRRSRAPGAPAPGRGRLQSPRRTARRQPARPARSRLATPGTRPGRSAPTRLRRATGPDRARALRRPRLRCCWGTAAAAP